MTVHIPEPGTAVIEIVGDVTAACEPTLMAAYEEACAPGTRFLVLDFAGLSYMNSGGIGMLVTLLVRANRQQQKLAAVGLTDHYRQIFELTRLDEAIALHTDAATALASA
jgi:anti-anti-sigma factor